MPAMKIMMHPPDCNTIEASIDGLPAETTASSSRASAFSTAKSGKIRDFATVTTRPSFLTRALRPVTAALIAAGALVFAAAAPEARACVACNISFGNEVLGDRTDSLIGQDIRRAMANQRGLPLDEMSGVSPEQRQSLEEAALLSLQSDNCCVSDDDTCVDSEKASDESDETAEPDLEEAAEGETPTAALDLNVFDEYPELTPIGEQDPAETSARSGQLWAPLSEKHPELYENEPFLEIIQRDEGLSIPTTSYVPQDIEADVEFTIELSEGLTYLGNGVIYDGFVTNGRIPGPTLRVKQGDIVDFNVVNKGTVPHGASIHAANTQTSKYVGQINPGQSKNVKFRATQPGVFMYHCAPGGHAIPMHVQFGQYGMIVVEPAEKKYKLEEELGREPDAILNIIQHGLYQSGADAIEGSPLYSLFNGKIFRYVEEPISVRPGDYVRIYFLNVGPNELSTFHFVGIVWDYVYWQGHPDAWMPGGQTVTAGPSDSWVIEFRAPPDEGAYTMLTHGVGEAARGSIGLLVVDRDAETPVYIDAEGPKHTQEELEQMKEEATRVVSPYRPASAPADETVYYGRETEEVNVRIIGNSYSPKVIQVTPGTKVTWVNEDVFSYMAGEFSGIHNVVTIGEPPERFASPLLAHGERFSFTFEEEGTYDYICTPHPYMEARVIVKEEALPPVDEVAEVQGPRTAGWAIGLAGLALILAVVGVLRPKK